MVKNIGKRPKNGKRGPNKCPSGRIFSRGRRVLRLIKGICDAVTEKGLEGELIHRAKWLFGIGIFQ